MITLVPLEFHETREGKTIPIYNSSEPKPSLEHVSMSYLTTIGPALSKGPIVHKLRNSIVVVASGAVEIKYRSIERDGSIFVSSNDKVALKIGPNVLVEYRNCSSSADAILLVYADLPFIPNSGESIKFNGWNDDSLEAYIMDSWVG